MKYALAIIVLFVSGCDVACFSKRELSDSLVKEIKEKMEDREIRIIGNTLENIESLKRDCEKDLPREQECVLIYEFVPVKTK